MEMVQTGSRPLTRAALAGRRRVLDDGRSVSRKELSAAAREAAKALDLRAALRVVLSELAAVWGEQAWARPIVWPSNEHLVSRTGLSERAVRYALRDLVAMELITPKDSANGKRYAIRAPDGTIVDAFGFDLTPVYARRGKWAAMIKARADRQERRKRAFDLLTIHRRAVAEALHALGLRYPETPIADLTAAQASLESTTPGRRGSGDPEILLEAWAELRHMVEERFYTAGDDGRNCRHIETDNGSPSESWSKGSPGPVGAVRPIERPALGPQPALVAAACPVVRDLVRGELREEHDILDAGRQLRASIGAHQSAWAEACRILGPLQAAVLVLIVAQLHDDDVTSGQDRIRNPGGYFRRLVRLTGEGRYNPEAELLAMRRRRLT
ncbi:plasmid replication protein RepC [Methylobacterium sp. ID0610]|uniref:plasmid replication protein RepC n=1 Tax=Methylobacterium carpenticola TaxID=3344827 RepID=UPI0036AF7EF3